MNCVVYNGVGDIDIPCSLSSPTTPPPLYGWVMMCGTPTPLSLGGGGGGSVARDVGKDGGFGAFGVGWDQVDGDTYPITASSELGFVSRRKY